MLLEQSGLFSPVSYSIGSTYLNFFTEMLAAVMLLGAAVFIEANGNGGVCNSYAGGDVYPGKKVCGVVTASDRF